MNDFTVSNAYNEIEKHGGFLDEENSIGVATLYPNLVRIFKEKGEFSKVRYNHDIRDYEHVIE